MKSYAILMGKGAKNTKGTIGGRHNTKEAKVLDH